MAGSDFHGETTVVAQARIGALIYLWLTAAVIALDQLTKALIEHSLNLYQSISVLPVLEITRLHNTGAAFSFLADETGWQRWLFTALALASAPFWCCGCGASIVVRARWPVRWRLSSAGRWAMSWTACGSVM
jgi:lipoprotein signal peptidase